MKDITMHEVYEAIAALPGKTPAALLLRAWIEAERNGANQRIDSASAPETRSHWVGYRHALDMVLARADNPAHPNDALAPQPAATETGPRYVDENGGILPKGILRGPRPQGSMLLEAVLRHLREAHWFEREPDAPLDPDSLFAAAKRLGAFPEEDWGCAEIGPQGAPRSVNIDDFTRPEDGDTASLAAADRRVRDARLKVEALESRLCEALKEQADALAEQHKLLNNP